MINYLIDEPYLNIADIPEIPFSTSKVQGELSLVILHFIHFLRKRYEPKTLIYHNKTINSRFSLYEALTEDPVKTEQIALHILSFRMDQHIQGLALFQVYELLKLPNSYRTNRNLMDLFKLINIQSK